MKKFRALFVLAAIAALSVSVAVAQPGRQGEPEEPRRHEGAGPGRLQGEFRHQRRHVRGRSAPRLGAERRRPLLQPREERLLRRRAGSSASCPNFMVQFGINGDPAVSAVWTERADSGRPGQAEQQARLHHLRDGRRRTRRTTQVFINFGDNTNLDSQGFAPFGKVVGGHGRRGQDQRQVRREDRRATRGTSTRGNAYLTKTYPGLDSIKKATIVQ